MSASVGRNSAIMAMGTLASRLTGQVRTILLAAAVGTTGIAANAYQTGSTIPQVLFTILSGGVFNAVLVPQIVRSLKQKDAEDQLNKLITLSVVILVAVTGIMMACSTLFTNLYLDSSWNAAQRSLANSFTLWCMPQIFFYGLYTVLGQVLAAKNQFGAYAWSSTGANVISCIGFIVFIALYGNASHQSLDFWTADKAALLAGSWTLGVAFQALVLFIPLLKSGYHWHPRLGLHGIGLRSMSSVAIWSLGIVLVNQLVGIVTSRVTNGAPLQGGDPYGIAGNSTYQNAFTLFILPYSLFAVSIATAMFPRMSEYIADGDYASARDELSSTLCNLTLIIAFFTVAYLVEPVQITTALLPSVQPNEVNLMRVPLMVMCVANVPTSAVLVLERTFYAFKDGRTPFWYTLAQNAVQVVIVLSGIHLFPPRDWVTVVCCGVALGNIVMMPIIYYLVHRHFPQGLDDRRIARTAAHTLTAMLIATVVGLVINKLFTLVGWNVLSIESMGTRWGVAIVQALVITAAAGGAYFGTLSALHTPEVAVVRGMVQRMLAKVLRRPMNDVANEGMTNQDEQNSSTDDLDSLDVHSLDSQSPDSHDARADDGSSQDAHSHNPRPRTAPRSARSSTAGAAAMASAPRQRRPRVVSSAAPSPFVPDDTAAGLDIILDLPESDDRHSSSAPAQFKPRKHKQRHPVSPAELQQSPQDERHARVDSQDQSVQQGNQTPQATHSLRPARPVSRPSADEFGRTPIWATRESIVPDNAAAGNAVDDNGAVTSVATNSSVTAGKAASSNAAVNGAPAGTARSVMPHKPQTPTVPPMPAIPAAPTESAAPAPAPMSDSTHEYTPVHTTPAPRDASYFPRAAGPADTESVELHKILTRAPQATNNSKLTVPRLDVPHAQTPKPLPYQFDDVARHASTDVHLKNSSTQDSDATRKEHSGESRNGSAS
ncbi:lipid II flippase MurJ [Pseudoscardovia suis]